MTKTWQLQEAKNRFSEVVEEAIHNGPQRITRRGKETAVLLSMRDFKKLKGAETGLVEFFQKSPLRGVELDLERRDDLPREVSL